MKFMSSEKIPIINAQGKRIADLEGILEIYDDPDIKFFIELKKLGIPRSLFNLTPNFEPVKTIPKTNLKFRLYMLQVKFKTLSTGNIFYKVFLDSQMIHENTLADKEINSNEFLLIDINRLVEDSFDIEHVKMLRIKFYSKDKNFNLSKIIGQTWIDLRNRYLNNKWHDII